MGSLNRLRALVCGLWMLQMVLRQLWLLGSPQGNLLRFGSEYGNIAESLALQGAFADAMGPGTGPTAWMPPALCWLYAAVFWSFGAKSVDSALVLVVLKALLTSLCLWAFLGLCQRRWGGRGTLAGLLLTLVWSECDAHRLYAELDDIWWVNALALGVLLQVVGEGSPTLRLGLAVLVPFSSPSLTLAWLLVSLVQRPPGWRTTVSLMAASCLFWGARNQATLGRFYPVKSNLWFDFAESNVWDDDGLLTHSFFRLYHPINANPMQRLYRESGEVAFVEAARVQARQVSVSTWVRRSLTRLSNAGVRTQIDWDLFPALQLPQEDIPRLVQSGWLVVTSGRPFWVFCLRPAEVFQGHLSRGGLAHPEQVWLSRQAACAELLRRHQQPRLWWSQWHFSLLPSLAVLGLLMRRRATPAIALYLLFLLPYVLVQHYVRYQVSVVWLQQFLILEACFKRR